MPKPESGRRVHGKLFWSGIVFLVGAVAIVLFVFLHRSGEVSNERERLVNEEKAGPRVRASKVTRSAAQQELDLTGEALPFAAATLYAKVSGYLSKVAVDKGDVVTKGQLLAVIESPETDQNYNAAVANAFNQKRVADRYKVLLKRKLVSQQEADQAFANARVAEANARQYRALKDYEQLTAPFDGKVTSRYADPGALIQNATGGQTGAMPVVTVSQTNELRIYVYVDQKYAPYVKPGLPVDVSLQERPETRWPSKVTRISGELDPATRMLLTEVDFDNSPSLIVPGSLVKVILKVPTPTYLEVPTAALNIRDNKPFVGVVQPNGKVDFREIQIVDNDGQTLRVRGAVQEGETVGLDLGSRVVEGSKVRVIAAQKEGESNRAPGSEKGK